jgi:hypothetical protein
MLGNEAKEKKHKREEKERNGENMGILNFGCEEICEQVEIMLCCFRLYLNMLTLKFLSVALTEVYKNVFGMLQN